MGQKYADVLVTNKHILEGADAFQVKFHVAAAGGSGPSGQSETATVVLAPGGIVSHPNDEVDLCAVSMSQLELAAKKRSLNVFYVPLDHTIVASVGEFANLDAIEEVAMIGCPNGLFDEVNSLPIIRRGHTASHPAMNYNGRSEFLIDAACFPGSSGSPVFLFNTGAYFDKVAGHFAGGPARIKLLGILHAGPTIAQDGRIVLGHQPRIEVASMMHLGCVLRATRLFELDDVIRAKAIHQSGGSVS